MRTYIHGNIRVHTSEPPTPNMCKRCERWMKNSSSDMKWNVIMGWKCECKKIHRNVYNFVAECIVWATLLCHSQWLSSKRILCERHRIRFKVFIKDLQRCTHTIDEKKIANKRRWNPLALNGIFCGVFPAFTATHFIFCHFMQQIQVYYVPFVYVLVPVKRKRCVFKAFFSFATFRWLFIQRYCAEAHFFHHKFFAVGIAPYSLFYSIIYYTTFFILAANLREDWLLYVGDTRGSMNIHNHICLPLLLGFLFILRKRFKTKYAG